MASVILSVVRPDDLLVATFELQGLAVDTQAGEARIVRSADDEEARIIVHLPPQSVAEASLDEAQAVLFSRLEPETLRTLRSGPSRLGFRLPAAVDALPLTLPALLDWDRLEAIPAIDDDDPPAEPRPPAPHETAIEAPWRLVLTTGREARWRHSKVPDPAAGPGLVTLWHTRLATGRGRTVVRAAWTPDLLEEVDPGFAMPLSAASRRDLVGMTADFHVLSESRFEFLTEDQQRRLELLRNRTPLSIPVDHLSLSALGADLVVHGSFDYPVLDPDLAAKRRGAAFDPSVTSAVLFALRQWNHRMTLGRDQHVRTSTVGYLFPFGHRAVKITVVDRELQRGSAAAVLRSREMLVPLEPERRFDAPGTPFDFPFVSARLTVPTGTPLRPTELAESPDLFEVPLVAVDRGGTAHGLVAPVAFVRANDPADLVAVAEAYGTRTVAAAGRTIAYVPPPPIPVPAAETGCFPTDELSLSGIGFGAEASAFRPRLAAARVHLEAIEGVVGDRGGVTSIAYDATYAQAGFVSGDEVFRFAEILGGVALALPAARLGGLAAPTINGLDSLSVARGASVRTPDAAAVLADIKGSLLGFLELRDLVAAAGTATSPVLKTIDVPGGRAVAFDWTLPIAQPGQGAGQLELRAEVPLGAASPRPAFFEGTLRDFRVPFAGLATLVFRELHFVAVSGRTPTVDRVGAAITFEGDLAFLQQLAEALGKAAPGLPGGTSVRVTPDGITAEIAQSLPSVAMGQFALVNLALRAAVELRLDAPATLRFAVSSRRDPFLVAYSAFGGGGYLELVLDMAGPRSLEAGIELGAVAEVDFKIAKASAHVMIGIYLSLDGSRSRLGGYVRVHGAVEILGLITVGVDMRLTLSYSGGVATGQAEITIFVQVLAFSHSVTLSVEYSFDTRDVGIPVPVADSPLVGAGGVPPTGLDEARDGARAPSRLRDRVSLDQWTSYLDAFA